VRCNCATIDVINTSRRSPLRSTSTQRKRWATATTYSTSLTASASFAAKDRAANSLTTSHPGCANAAPSRRKAKLRLVDEGEPPAQNPAHGWHWGHACQSLRTSAGNRASGVLDRFPERICGLIGLTDHWTTSLSCTTRSGRPFRTQRRFGCPKHDEQALDS
jgi:hypothetical protein